MGGVTGGANTALGSKPLANALGGDPYHPITVVLVDTIDHLHLLLLLHSSQIAEDVPLLRPALTT